MLRLHVTALLLVTLATSSAASDVTIRELKVLIPIYRGAATGKDRLSDEDVQGIKKGIELGRLFYFRNTKGKLNLALTFMVIDEPAPKNDGPTYEFIEKDLRARGIKDNQYDGVFTTGVGMTGNWGGFRILGWTGAAFGGPDKRGGLFWYPEDKPDVWYGAAWTFVHEFQHALDSPIASGSGHPEMLSGHPYSDSMECYFSWGHHAGQHWDWEAHTLSSFNAYMDVRGATDSTITFADADDDGLPDDDSRLPMDEKRFGSDPSKKDTDGDGLDDLAEFCADIFRGSDPRRPDTDSDGIPDGKDRYPTVAIAETLRYSAKNPALDGKIDPVYAPLTLGTYVATSDDLAAGRIFACWNEDALSLFVRSSSRCTAELMIDTSGENGFWEGGDTYLISATPDGSVRFTGLGLEGPVPGAKAVWGPDGLEIYIPVRIGQGVSHEINWGGKRRPEDTVDGMVLLPDRAVSFNIALSSEQGRALMTPNWSMFDVVPIKSEADPPRPSLRFNKKITSAAEPVLTVTGIGRRDQVSIVDGKGRIVGVRIGSGEVILTGALRQGSDARSGANVLRAWVKGRQSEPFTLIIDRAAAAPSGRLATGGRTLLVSGEPGARVEVYAGIDRYPIWPVGSLMLDTAGAGKFELAAGMSGFNAAYGLGMAFDRPILRRIDREIKFNFEAGTPSPEIPSDGFCARWTGFLDVPSDGDYTFYLSTDDGSRLWLDGRQLIDNWGHHAVEERSRTVHLNKGEHELRIDYYEEYGWAAAHLEWSGPGIERTHSLPVRPLPSTSSTPVYFIRQTDEAGNISRFAVVKK